VKKILIAIAAFSLTSCATLDRIVSSPAPLAATTIDEKTLVIALQTFDVALTAVDRLIDAKVIVPGSPRALQIADAIHKAKVAYQAASAAQRAGNSSSYFTALAQAQMAVGQIQVLIKGN
jgi:hypothetical protein